MKTDIDLTPFLSKDESRAAICRPFSIGEWTYATDGRIMVRVSRREDVPEYDSSPKSAPDLFIGTVRPWRELPDFEAYPLDALEREKDCERCNGDGWVTCASCGNSERCSECDGDGIIDEAPEQKGVMIDGTPLGQLYLTLIKALPNARIGVALHSTHPAHFIFDGGEGILMPLKSMP
jgi:hypothetical protein